MTTLIVGGNGVTGSQVVEQLLIRNQEVRIIVRSAEKLPQSWKDHDNLKIIEASILNMEKATLSNHLSGCNAVVSCLGHNMSLKGIFGPPQKLVTDAIRKLCHGLNEQESSNRPIKFILMNTAGHRNQNEVISLGHKIALYIIRNLLPPHRDNECAASFLRDNIGPDNHSIEYVVVRPDTLINEEKVSDYSVFPSPTRSAIFNPGKTSRINVGHFMAELLTDENLWTQWKGQMPVIYNKSAI